MMYKFLCLAHHAKESRQVERQSCIILGQGWVRAAWLNGSKCRRGLAVEKLVFERIWMSFNSQIGLPIIVGCVRKLDYQCGFHSNVSKYDIHTLFKGGCLEGNKLVGRGKDLSSYNHFRKIYALSVCELLSWVITLIL